MTESPPDPEKPAEQEKPTEDTKKSTKTTEAKEPIKTAPITPEGLIDVVQAAGAQTSENPGQKEFGTLVVKKFFDDLPKEFEKDEVARSYLREVLAATASAIRAMSVERTSFKAARARRQKVDDLRLKLLEPRFFFSPVEGEKAKTLFSVLGTLTPAGFGAFLATKFGHEQHPYLFWVIVGVTLFWFAYAEVLIAWSTVWLQTKVFSKMKDGHQETQEQWQKSFPRYKKICADLLLTTARVRERFYPNDPPLLGKIRLANIPAYALPGFLETPHPELQNQTPENAIQQIVDLHFSLDSGKKESATPATSAPVTTARQLTEKTPGKLKTNTPKALAQAASVPPVAEPQSPEVKPDGAEASVATTKTQAEKPLEKTTTET